ncbi:MAG: PAS domain-containing protein [Solirubrobacteraceae bacterium]
MSAVLVTDPQLRIIRVNQAFCALSGFDTAELVGRRPPLDRAAGFPRPAADA